MSGKPLYSFWICLAFVFAGCAQAKYEQVGNALPTNTSQSEKVTFCKSRFLNSGYCLLWHWEKKPTSSQAGSLIFKIVRANALDDSPVPVDQNWLPILVLWMPSMGHGSTPTSVQRVDVGSYRATNVFFIMPGEWELKFQLKDANKVHDEVAVDLTF